jgi:hypothetical protein
MLVSGEHGYPSRSQAAMALALAMCNRGWAWEDFCAALSDPGNDASRWYSHRRNGAPRTSHDIAARLKRDWSKASETVRSSPAVADGGEMRQELSLDAAVLADEVWTGRTAVTDYIVLSAAYERGIELGRRDVDLPTRTIAEMAGVSQKCARVALQRLREAKQLILVQQGRNGLATTYRLVKRQCAKDSSSSRGSAPPGRESRAHSVAKLAASNLFRWIGRHGVVVYRAVLDGARTIPEIIERSGVSRRSVFKYLKALAETKLVSKDSWGYTAHEVDDLDAEAARQGAPDKAGLQRLAHVNQRRGFRIALPVLVKGGRWRLFPRRT